MLNNRALLLLECGKEAEAERLLRRAVRILEDALTPEDDKVVQARENLAALALRQGRFAEAEYLERQLLVVRERICGPDHPLVGETLNKLASACSGQHKDAEAEALYRRALALWDRMNTEHVNAASTANNFANLLSKQRRYSEAEPLYARALASAERLLGGDHPMVGEILVNFSAMLRRANRGREAKRLDLWGRTIMARHQRQNLAGLTVDTLELSRKGATGRGE